MSARAPFARQGTTPEGHAWAITLLPADPRAWPEPEYARALPGARWRLAITFADGDTAVGYATTVKELRDGMVPLACDQWRARQGLP